MSILHDGGEKTVVINQRTPAEIDGAFDSLGVFSFDAAKQAEVVISNEGTEDGVVIADCVIFLPHQPDQQPIATETDDDTKAERESRKKRIARLKNAVDVIQAELKSLEQSAPQQPIAMACADEAEPSDIHLAIRGVVHNKGPVVPRGVLQVASQGELPAISQSGRRELADWIAGPKHPLTARVMANRVWYWLIGRGMVATVDNFGSTGARPSHPLLLDHLARSFIDDRWSVKRLVKRIVMSRVYRLGTTHDQHNASVDPDNRWLWRMNRKRLRAEDIRDTLLFIGGTLDLTGGGPTIKAGTKIEYGYKFTGTRRSVYVPVFRNTLPEIFEVFDFADPNIQQGGRTESTIASQALLLMNHPIVYQQSTAAAEKMPEESQFDTVAGVQHAYYQVLGRPPRSAEQELAVDFVDNPGGTPDRLARWAMLYQTLFQCVDFRYLN